MLKIEHGEESITISLVLQTPSRLRASVNNGFRTWSGPDFSALILLLIPVLVLAGDRSVTFNLPGYLDPWFYFALFRRPATLAQLFPDTYYGSRLSFILPGALIHRILPPVAANYVFHLLVWLGAVLGLYVALRYLAGRRTALLSAVIFGFYPYLWKATGWDYPDGAGIAYYLLTVAGMTVAASRPQASRLFLIVAGVACAAAFYCNMVWMFFMPFFPVFWICIRKIQGRSIDLVRSIAWFAAGAAVCSVGLALVSHMIGGEYLFYLPSIRFARQSAHTPNPWKAKGTAWIWNSYYLLLPAIGLVAGLIVLARQSVRQLSARSQLALVLCCNFLFCAGIFIFGEFRDMDFLETFYYASCLMAPLFLFLGATIWEVPERMGQWTFRMLLAAAIVLLAGVYWDHQGVVWPRVTVFGRLLPIAIAVGAFLVASIYPHTAKLLGFTLAAMTIVVFTARPLGFIFQGGDSTENAFDRIVESGNYLEQYRKGRTIRFWFGQDSNSQEFASINSLYFYGYSQFSLNFPKLPDTVPNLTDSVLALLSTDSAAPARGLQTLQAAGLKGKLVGQRRITRGGVSYTIGVFEFDIRGFVNGDFEAGTTGWGGGWAKLSTQDGGQSGKCLVLEAEKGGAQYAMQWNALRLKPSGHYKLSFWVKSGSSGDEPFQAGLWDTKRSQWDGFQAGRSTQTWTAYSIDIRNPPSYPLSVELIKQSSTKGSMLFDTVTVNEEP